MSDYDRWMRLHVQPSLEGADLYPVAKLIFDDDEVYTEFIIDYTPNIIIIGDVEGTVGIRQHSPTYRNRWNLAHDNNNTDEVIATLNAYPEFLKIFLGDIINAYDIDKSMGPLRRIMTSIMNDVDSLDTFIEKYAPNRYGIDWLLEQVKTLNRSIQLRYPRDYVSFDGHKATSIQIIVDETKHMIVDNPRKGLHRSICILGNKEIEILDIISGGNTRINRGNNNIEFMIDRSAIDRRSDDYRILSYDDLRLLYVYLLNCVDYATVINRRTYMGYNFLHSQINAKYIEEQTDAKTVLNIVGHRSTVNLQNNILTLDNTMLYSGARGDHNYAAYEESVKLHNDYYCCHLLNLDRDTIIVNRKDSEARCINGDIGAGINIDTGINIFHVAEPAPIDY